MNIAAYCRVSTEKDDQLNSLEAQKDFFSAYAKNNNHNLVYIYADEGISGTKTKNRTEFLHMMNDAKKGKFSVLIVKDISRLARNTVDLLQSVRQLKEYGIETMFLTANMTSMGNSEFVLTMFAALAQEESSNTSKRVKFGKKINSQKGKVPNFVYGYDKTKGDYFNLKINQNEAEIVKRIYSIYIKSGFGAHKIAQMLNDEGIKTKRGYKWSQNAITRILTNEIYIGKIINGKQEVENFLTGKRLDKKENDWIICENPKLRLIDDDTFNKALEILHNRQQKFDIKKERQSNKHLFSTIIKCNCCGYSYRRDVKKYKNTYIRWTCSGRSTNGIKSCDNYCKIGENELKTAIKDYFISILNNKNLIMEKVKKEFEQIYNKKQDNMENEKEFKNRLQKAHNIKNKYINMYEDDLISKEAFKEKVIILNKEIKKIEDELHIGKYNIQKSDKFNKVLEDVFKNIESIVDIDYMTNAQLKRVIEKISVNKNGRIDVHLKLF